MKKFIAGLFVVFMTLGVSAAHVSAQTVSRDTAADTAVLLTQIQSLQAQVAQLQKDVLISRDPYITSFFATRPDPVNGGVTLSWTASAPTDAFIEFSCPVNAISFYIKEDNRTVGCEKGGLANYTSQTGNSISFQPVGNTVAVSTTFTLKLFSDGIATGQSQGVTVLFNPVLPVGRFGVSVAPASDTPSGSIGFGQTGVTLAKFTITANGDAATLAWLGWGLNIAGATSRIDSLIKNVSLVDDVGNQIGTTIPVLSTAAQCTDVAYSNTTAAYRNCFGNASSFINYVIPTRTTRTLYLRADIMPGAAFSTITALLTGNTNNVVGATSAQVASTGFATGKTLTASSAGLTVMRNPAVGTQTISLNSTNRLIGSYQLIASPAEAVRVSTITIKTGSAGAQFQNLKLFVNTFPFGSTQATLGNGTAYTFSGAQFTVPASSTTTIDVYADVLSSATPGIKSIITTLSGCTANGAVSFSAISCISTSGQDVIVANQPTLTVSSAARIAASQVTMGSVGNTLATFTFRESSNLEDINIVTLHVTDAVLSTASVKSSFNSLQLYKYDGSLVATAGIPNTSVSGHDYYYKFNFIQPVVVPRSGEVSLILKGDVSSYASSGATDNAVHTFRVGTTPDSDNNALMNSVVGAYSATSFTTANILPPLGAVANPVRVLRTVLTTTASGLGATTGRTPTSVDDLGIVTVAADSAGGASLNKLALTFTGAGIANSNFMNGVSLVDLGGSNVTLSGAIATTQATCSTKGLCAKTKTWSFGSGASGWRVNAGSNYPFKVRINSLLLNGASTSTPQTLMVAVNNASDVLYTDGFDSSAATTISLPTSVVPIVVNSVAYGIGSIPLTTPVRTSLNVDTSNNESLSQLANLLETARQFLEQLRLSR